MKVLYLTRGFGDYVIELAKAMSRHVDAYLALAKNDEWITRYINNNANIFLTGAPRVSDIRNLFTLFRLINYVKKINPDIIHLQSGAVWELALFKIFKEIPFVVTVHDVNKHPMRGALRFIPKIILDAAPRRAAGVIIHAEALRSDAEIFYKNNKRRQVIECIEHGVISRYGIGQASIMPKNMGVLMFGTLDEWKGVEYFVECEAIVRKRVPGAQFIVAGASSDPTYYSRLPKTGQNIEMRIKRQDDRNVRELFKWADVLVLPYIEASQSGVLQLGFSFSIPPVVTSVGGLPEVITHELNGLIVPPKDAASLSAAIIRLLTDYKLREKIIKCIIKERESKYNWCNIALKTVNLYYRLLE